MINIINHYLNYITHGIYGFQDKVTKHLLKPGTLIPIKVKQK